MKIAKGPVEDLRPTNAGILFFNENPEEFIPNAQIDLIIHKEIIGKEYFEKIFQGDIHTQLKDVLGFIKAHIVREEIIKVENIAEANRFYNYPFQAIEEIIVNAVFHKSYEKNNPIEIQVHPDKIEILSFTGPLPPIDNKTLKKKRIIVRDYRNRKIGDFLKELHLTEGRGTGFPIIYKYLENNGSPGPVFETDEDRVYFLSIIYIHPDAKQISPVTKDFSNIDDIKDNIDKLVDIESLNGFLKKISVRDSVEVSVEVSDRVSAIVNDVASDKDKLITTLKFCKTPKSRIDVMDKLQLINHSNNFNRHIKPLIGLGWLQMTQPDKSRSSTQKYIITKLGFALLKILT
jgi:ATP-dependent DNA helicase RecG